jgi:hypothetical protein
MNAKSFIRLSFKNMRKYYHTHRLVKGALVKYRFNHQTITSYHLDAEEEEWRIGIISDVNWYITPPYSSYAVGNLDEERVCYDLSVHNISDASGIELINLESSEIFLLTD